MGYRQKAGNQSGSPDFNLGERIKTARTLRKVSQEELAMLLEVYQKDISRWENNICAPSVYIIRKICEILEVSADELLDINIHSNCE